MRHGSISCVTAICFVRVPWWRHQMETFSSLLAPCEGNSPVVGEFPAQRPVTRSFDVFFDRRQSNGWVNTRGCWFETLSRPLWRHCKATGNLFTRQVELCGIYSIYIFNYLFFLPIPSTCLLCRYKYLCVMLFSTAKIWITPVAFFTDIVYPILRHR